MVLRICGLRVSSLLWSAAWITLLRIHTPSTDDKDRHLTYSKVSHKDIEHIGIDPNASIFSDVLSLEHHPGASTVTLYLNSSGRCPTPYVRGRLSGPALVIINDWKYHTNNKDNSNTTTLIGTYRAPVTGTYFMELITVYCYNFLLWRNATRNKNATTTIADNDYNFAKTCTEPSHQRRLTLEETTIHVTMATPSNGGYWGAKEQTPAMTPAYTRFQTPDCYRSSASHCNTSLQSNQALAKYEWKPSPVFDREQQEYAISDNANANASAIPKVCVIGSSHARNLVDALNSVAVGNTTSLPWWSPTTIAYYDARIPKQVHAGLIQHLLTDRRGGGGNQQQPCTHLVISVGQWPASKHFRINPDSPYSFQKFYASYREMLEMILHHSAVVSANNNVSVFVRSINYNPLGALMASCPPSDWRTPLVIDGYNAAIQQVVQDLGDESMHKNLHYIDTSTHLVGPVWDGADDWCHLGPLVRELHAQEVLRQVLVSSPSLPSQSTTTTTTTTISA